MVKAKPKKEAKPSAKVKKAQKAKKQVKTNITVKKEPKVAKLTKNKKTMKSVVAAKKDISAKKEANVVEKPIVEEKELGEVTNYFEHVNAAAIKLVSPLNAGDTIHIKGGEVDFEQTVTSMQINRVPVANAKKGDEVGIRVNQNVRKGYKVYLK